MLETNVGLSRELSRLVAGFIQIAFWAGTFPPIFLIDRLGRRKVLILGSTILTLAMVLFTVGIALGNHDSSRLALGMLIIYEFSFGMSWNSVPWLYAPEITPLNIRHIGAAIGCFSEWLWTFVCGFSPPPTTASLFPYITWLTDGLGYRTHGSPGYRKYRLENIPSFLYNARAQHPIRLLLFARGSQVPFLFSLSNSIILDDRCEMWPAN